MLRRLTAVNFRNIERIDIAPGSGINYFFGHNGAGKTSLFEAMDFLSRGRTFRSRLSRALIRENASGLAVSATLDVGTRLESKRSGVLPGQAAVTTTRINGRVAASQVEVARELPLRILGSGTHRQVQSEAEYWRKALDWGVFHVKHSFSDAWRDYRRTLRQRNALLREVGGASRLSLGQWDSVIAKQAMLLDSARSEYAGLLMAEVETRASEQGIPLQLRYFRGWSAGEDIQKTLAEAEEGDRRAGYTRYGPHRATLRLLWDGKTAGERASLGQQKSAAALLMLAQVRIFARLTGRDCIVMVDDLASEFDECRVRWLIEELRRIRQQVFVTATAESLGVDLGDEAERFHMKHGGITQSAP